MAHLVKQVLNLFHLLFLLKFEKGFVLLLVLETFGHVVFCDGILTLRIVVFKQGKKRCDIVDFKV